MIIFSIVLELSFLIYIEFPSKTSVPKYQLRFLIFEGNTFISIKLRPNGLKKKNERSHNTASQLCCLWITFILL